jgi:hypothetical protein
MRLMQQRPAGNRFPDNDRTTAGVSAAAHVHVVACR